MNLVRVVVAAARAKLDCLKAGEGVQARVLGERSYIGIAL